MPDANRPAGTTKAPRIWGTLASFVEEGPILGRRVANSTFLKALLKADPYDAYHFFLMNEGSGEYLNTWIGERFPALLERKAVHIGHYMELQKRLSDTSYHCMHLSDILTHYITLTRLRNAFSPVVFPVTGLTHSLSYAHFMEDYTQHLWEGVSSRDAIIVTSESARKVMESVFTGLREAYGLDEKRFLSTQLVQLPLGVDIDELPGPEQHWRAGGENNPGLAMRAELGLGEEPLFLYFGRICPSSKMDLIPLLNALRKAEKLGLPPQGYALALAGWVEEGDELLSSLCSYAAAMGIRAIPRPRPSQKERLALYAAADVFISPSDNIQETFGLTVAEASAAGLPVIASDFDGYRDIVLHEHTGLLIPTLGFSRSGESDLQALYWYGNQYHMKLAQEVVVDIPALAAALALLGTDRELRGRMGDAGRTHALRNFGWDKVMERYVSLWDSLAAAPIPDEEMQRLRAAVHPQQMRFARYFAGHFSRVLDAGTLRSLRVKRTETGEAVYTKALPMLMYMGMEHMLDQEAVRRLLLAARKSISAEEATDKLSTYFREQSRHEAGEESVDFSRERAEFTLLWCLKQGHLEIVEK